VQLSPLDPEAPSFPDRDSDAVCDGAPRGKRLKRALRKRLNRLEELQVKLHANGRYALLIVLQGRDSAGKDGTIRRVFGTCPPQIMHVTNFQAPDAEARQHDYLWRVHRCVPAYGTVGVFNRSHYEDVVAARVHDLVPKEQWRKRFDQINDFERMLAENRVIILKFFLHVSREEQRRRMLRRLAKPKRAWKFQIGDLDDRALWDAYQSAYHDVFRRCSTHHAPWYIVPADNKKVRDYLVAGVVARRLKKLGLDYPDADPDEIAHAQQALHA
jgi:PPK2 family polyphosphate:nucleotide phosphotransferase